MALCLCLEARLAPDMQPDNGCMERCQCFKEDELWPLNVLSVAVEGGGALTHGHTIEGTFASAAVPVCG